VGAGSWHFRHMNPIADPREVRSLMDGVGWHLKHPEKPWWVARLYPNVKRTETEQGYELAWVPGVPMQEFLEVTW